MAHILLGVLALLCSVGVNLGDEAQPHVHHHRVTGPGTHVTRVHRVTHVPGVAQPVVHNGGDGHTSRVLPETNVHVHRVTGKHVTHVHRYTIPGEHHHHHTQQTTPAPTSKVVEKKPSKSSSSESYDTISEVYEVSYSPESYEVIYEEIYSSPSVSEDSSSSLYEIVSGKTRRRKPRGSSSSVYEILSGKNRKRKPRGPTRGSSYDSTMINGGFSHSGLFGVSQRTRCNRGLIDKTATGVRNTVNGGVSKIMGAISSITDSGKVLGPVGGLVNAVGHAGGHLIQGKLNEIDYMVNDAACGIGNIANAAADMVKTGNVLSGVANIGKELVGGIGNIGEDFVSQAATGIGNAANDILGFLGR